MQDRFGHVTYQIDIDITFKLCFLRRLHRTVWPLFETFLSFVLVLITIIFWIIILPIITLAASLKVR